MKLPTMTAVTLSLVFVVCNNESDDTVSLYDAVKANEVSQVKMLIDDGVHINVADDLQWTPLHYAVHEGHASIVALLLAEGADPNAKDLDAWTPLHLASREGQVAIAELLVTNGADTNSMAAEVPTGRLTAQLSYPDKELVVHAAYDWTSLFAAITSGHQNVVEFLLANGADVNAKRSSGETVLLFAVSQGNTGLVELLVANGADVNAEIKNGWTLLHEATYRGYDEIVLVLRRMGRKRM